MPRVAVPLALTRERTRPRPGRLVRADGPTMGVAWSVAAVVPDGVTQADLRRAAQGAADRVVAQMSQWEPDSELSRFNAAPPGWVAVSPELAQVAGAGLELARRTGGAFDPTLGRLTDLWGFGPAPPGAARPSAEALASAPAGWAGLELDAAGRRLRQPGGVALDLSGIAKGYGVDRVAAAVEALGVRDYLVEIGGELRGAGVKPSGEPWFVAVEPPPGLAAADEPVWVALHDLAVATSGEWRRRVTDAAGAFGHTLDPASRRPIDNGVEQVSVLHESCMWADALCTALAVLGPERGLAFAEAQGIAALFVLRSPGGVVERASAAFAALLA